MIVAILWPAGSSRPVGTSIIAGHWFHRDVHYFSLRFWSLYFLILGFEATNDRIMGQRQRACCGSQWTIAI